MLQVGHRRHSHLPPLRPTACPHLARLQGWTPLHTATSAGLEQIATLLISLGADVNASTAQKRTPLHYAASKGQAALAALLVQGGAAAGGKDCLGATPLHRAASTGKVEVIKLLLAAGAKIDARNQDGATPLLLAALGGHQAAAIYLAAKGADVEVRRDPSAAALQCSQPANQQIGHLLALMADATRPPPPTAAATPAMQAEDKEGETPLGAAAKHGKLREGLVAIAKGEQTLDDFMME